MAIETYEQALKYITEEGRLWHTEHDAEFERHLGFSKQHSFHAPARKEMVHMYMAKDQKPKKLKPGEKKPSLKQTIAGMMKYHGYEKIKNASKTRLSFSRDQKNKYHEVHVDIDKNGEPRQIYHKERFK